MGGNAVQIFLSLWGDDSGELFKFALFVSLDDLDGLKLLERPTDNLTSSSGMALRTVSSLSTASEHMSEVSNTPVTANVDLTGYSGNSDVEPIGVEGSKLF